MKLKIVLPIVLIGLFWGDYLLLSEYSPFRQMVPNAGAELSQSAVPDTGNSKQASVTNYLVEVAESFIKYVSTKSNCEVVFPSEKDSEIVAAQDAYIMSLKDATEPHKKVAHVLFKKRGEDGKHGYKEKQPEYLAELIALNRAEVPLVAFEIIRACTYQNNSPQCTNELIEEITSLHSDDSQAWSHAVNYYAKTEQDEKVIATIKRALEGKYTSSPYFLTINTYYKMIEEAEISNFAYSFSSALWHGTVSQLYHDPISRWCRGDNLTNVQVAQACLEIGQLWENTSLTLFDIMMGVSIQGIVHEAQGNNELVKLAESRRDALYTPLKKLSVDDQCAMFKDEDFTRMYFELFESHGEVGTFQAIEKEILNRKSAGFFTEIKATF